MAGLNYTAPYIQNVDEETFPNRPFLMANRKVRQAADGSEYTPMEYIDPLSNVGKVEASGFIDPANPSASLQDVQAAQKNVLELRNNYGENFLQAAKARAEGLLTPNIENPMAYNSPEERRSIYNNIKGKVEGVPNLSEENFNVATDFYKSFKDLGLSDKQSAVVTAEIGRENGFNPKYIFGGHLDLSGRSNVGALSWNGDRSKKYISHMAQAGLIDPKTNSIVRSPETIKATAQYILSEMASPQYRGKLKNFFGNPEADDRILSHEVGRSYIGWAEGQNTVKHLNGSRKAFDWKSHAQKRDGYKNLVLTQIAPMFSKPS